MADRIGTSAGTITGGQRALSAQAAGRKVPQFLQKTVNVSANVAPFYSLIKKVGKKKVVRQPAYFHLETDWLPQNVTDSGSGLVDGTGSATLNVAAGHGKRVEVGSVLKVLRTGEELLVTAISTDALTVTRGTAHAAINASEEIEILSHAASEGAAAGNGMSSEPSIVTNYTQTFRAPIQASGRLIQSEVYGDDEWARMQKDATEMVMQQLEKAFLFQEQTSSSDPTRTGGAASVITTNVSNIAGTLTEARFNQELQKWFRRNHMQKNCVLFAGENFRLAMDGWGRDTIRYSPNDDILGISAGTYQSSFGAVTVVPHGLFSPVGSDVTAANYGWQGYAMFLNLDLLGRAVFKGREWIVRDEIQTPGVDGKKWEILTDEGFYLCNEKAHGICKGITG